MRDYQRDTCNTWPTSSKHAESQVNVSTIFCLSAGLCLQLQQLVMHVIRSYTASASSGRQPLEMSLCLPGVQCSVSQRLDRRTSQAGAHHRSAIRAAGVGRHASPLHVIMAMHT